MVTENMTSWADEIENEDNIDFPPSHEKFDEQTGTKVFTEYRRNKDRPNEIEKVVRTSKIERKLVSRSIAERKNWCKFGESRNDTGGPQSKTTIVGETIHMQFVSSNKDDVTGSSQDEALKKLSQTRVQQCRICKGDHWSVKCPYKDAVSVDALDSSHPVEENVDLSSKSQTGKYVPPGMRDGAGNKGESMNFRNGGAGRDELATVRVSNLSEDVRETDLNDLFKPFGPIQRIYLAKDKLTTVSRGFAYINYVNRSDAAKAIEKLSGYGYDHLILHVEWARPSANP